MKKGLRLNIKICNIIQDGNPGLKHSPDEKGIGFGNAERGTRNLECEKRKWEVKNEKGRFDRTN